MPLIEQANGSFTFVRTKPIKSLLPTHGYQTEEGWLPATPAHIEKLERLAQSSYTTDECRIIVKTALSSLNLTRARARETIMTCKSDWELFFIDIKKVENGTASGNY